MREEKEINDMPEKLRKKIDDVIKQAGNDVFPPELNHMLSSIMLEMYKSGWRDAFRGMKISLETMEKAINK